jgi:hypothetical protein
MTSSSSPRYRDFLRKVVDNVWAGPRDRLTTNWPRQFGFPTALSVGTVGQTRSALNLSLPGRAGTVLTRPEARIDPGSDGEPGFHLIAQARLPRLIGSRASTMTRAIDAAYQGGRKPRPRRLGNWSSLV